MRKLLLVPALLLLLLAAPAEGKMRIIGGTDTNTTSWTGIASLQDRSAPSAHWGHFCGGSLVRPRWVLTARHCVVDGVSENNLDVLLGRSNLRSRGGERIAVVRILKHPQHDVALLYLARAAGARTFSLARTRPADGATGRVAGWGATRTSMPSQLQQTDVQAIADSACQKAYPWDFQVGGEMCAGWMEGGRDACQGDSGGPLLFGGQLAGVVSYGTGCGDRGFPGVYAKVSAVLPWIEGRFQNPPTNFRPQTPGKETSANPKPYVVLSGNFTYPSPERPYFEHATSVSSNYHFRELRMKIERGSSPYCIQTGACFAPGQWFLPPIGNGGKSTTLYYQTTTTCPLVSFWARLEDGTTKSGQTGMCIRGKKGF